MINKDQTLVLPVLYFPSEKLSAFRQELEVTIVRQWRTLHWSTLMASAIADKMDIKIKTTIVKTGESPCEAGREQIREI